MTYAFYKRLIDICVSAAALLLLLPLMLLIAIAIVLESCGSPLFLQQRIGCDDRIFHIVKFRSMVKDAPLLGPWHTVQNDPRITRVGKFLRMTSIDELPQMWNVLKGDMSLVGPRPEVPMRKDIYSSSDWEQRHRVRPGITGLAQVSGRSDLSDAEQLRCDLAYAANPTMRGDFDIILKTIWVIMRREGVN